MEAGQSHIGEKTGMNSQKEIKGPALLIVVIYIHHFLKMTNKLKFQILGDNRGLEVGKRS